MTSIFRYLWAVASIAICVSVEARPFSQTDSLLIRLDRRLSLLDSLIFASPASLPEGNGHSFSRSRKEREVMDRLLSDKEQVRHKELKSVTGLELTSQFYYRPTRSAAGYLPEEDDAYVGYRAKLQAELKWNVLQSSLIKRETKKNIVSLENRVERIQAERHLFQMDIEESNRLLDQQYAMRQTGLLKQHLENLELLAEVNQHLLNREKISGNDLIKTWKEKNRVEQQLAALPAFPSACETFLSNPSASVVHIDTVSLFRHIRENHSQLKILQMQRELSDLKYKDTDYWQTVGISPYVRVSHYRQTFHAGRSTDMDIGVSVRFPLTSVSGQKRRSLQVDSDILAFHKEVEERRILEEIRHLYGEVENRNRAVKQASRQVTEWRKYLQSRKEAYRHSTGQVDRILRMQEYDLYLDAVEKLVNALYGRDKSLIVLKQGLEGISLPDIWTETVIL